METDRLDRYDNDHAAKPYNLTSFQSYLRKAYSQSIRTIIIHIGRIFSS